MPAARSHTGARCARPACLFMASTFGQSPVSTFWLQGKGLLSLLQWDDFPSEVERGQQR